MIASFERRPIRVTCASLATLLIACVGCDKGNRSRVPSTFAPESAVLSGGAAGMRDASAGSAMAADTNASGGGRSGSGSGGSPSLGGAGSGPPTQVMNAAGGGAGGKAGAGGGPPGDTGACTPRTVAGDAKMHFHHVHFNTVDVAKDVEFFMKFYDAKPVEFCKDATGTATQAIATERGYFLFTKVDKPPNPELNSHLDHVGWLSADPSMELQRQRMLGVPLWPRGDPINGQCMEVETGMACLNGVFFYTQTPGSGARIEVSSSPGPATSGFGHMHLKGPLDPFFMQALDGVQMVSSGVLAMDDVNITNALLGMYPPAVAVETKGKPIDHVAFSTTDLMAQYQRIKAAGIAIQEEISVKPEYGFKSFFIKSPQGVWLEIVEDSPFTP